MHGGPIRSYIYLSLQLVHMMIEKCDPYVGLCTIICVQIIPMCEQKIKCFLHSTGELFSFGNCGWPWKRDMVSGWRVDWLQWMLEMMHFCLCIQSINQSWIYIAHTRKASNALCLLLIQLIQSYFLIKIFSFMSCHDMSMSCSLSWQWCFHWHFRCHKQ